LKSLRRDDAFSRLLTPHFVDRHGSLTPLFSYYPFSLGLREKRVGVVVTDGARQPASVAVASRRAELGS
jgi:hypothetical protein